MRLCMVLMKYFSPFHSVTLYCLIYSLNPHVKNYGGLGNLFIGALGIQFFALSINRIAIFNNALITDLFNHPDPRQSWTPIPTTVVNGEMKEDIAGFEAINLRLPMKHFDGVRFIGSHGVPAMEAGFNNFAENNLLAKYYPTESPPVDNAFYRNTVCQVSLSCTVRVILTLNIYNCTLGLFSMDSFEYDRKRKGRFGEV